MKILYLNLDRGIPVLGDKGASVHVREFIRAAAAQEHEVLLICARLGEGNPLPPAQVIELAPDHPPEALAALGRVLGVPRISPPIEKELSRLAYDQQVGERVLTALAARGFVPDFLYERHCLFSRAGVHVATVLGKPRILEVNAPLAEEQKRFRGLCLEATAQRMEVDSFRGSDRIIAVSTAIRAHVCTVADVSHERVHVIPNGVDVQRMANTAGRDEIRSRLGYREQDCAITFIGSFKSWHGTGFLLDAFTRIAGERAGARLLMVGEGPQKAAFCARAAAEGCKDRVTAVGRVAHADIPAWLSAADVVFAPYEASADFYFSPLKVLEALAAGRPVVAPRIGQLTELIRHGETGLLYRPGDINACRDALLTLIDDPQRRHLMGRAARCSVADRGWDGVVRQVIGLAASRPAQAA